MSKNESVRISVTSGQEIELNRPDPIVSDLNAVHFNSRMDLQMGVDALVAGQYVLIEDFYSSGLTLLNALKQLIKKKHSDQSFQGQREFRSAFRELSHRLLLLVSSHKLSVRKAPQIGWLRILYPDLNEFVLPFTQVQGLNSAWQWYEKGISIPVLDHKIHPYYGTYFPTRFEHLRLFDNWLNRYDGDKKTALDIGIGCGVLSFQMINHGFTKICGTDSNPNAIVGLDEDLTKQDLHSKISLIHGDLFADCKLKTELIVFNPPWLPATYHLGGLDKAIYYDQDLFPRFFLEATKHLKPDGIVVLLFSNLGRITSVDNFHPIEAELASGGRFEKALLIQKKVRSASRNTRRNQNWRTSEMVELWVLKQAISKEK